MMLLPPPKDACPVCAVRHEDHMPHNALSMYYLYRFYGLRGRWPTWADALAHCTPEMQAAWKQQLLDLDEWTEPDPGVETIADPPAESLNQPVGDVTSCNFGPEGSE